jgi:hypothetical protein
MRIREGVVISKCLGNTDHEPLPILREEHS